MKSYSDLRLAASSLNREASLYLSTRCTLRAAPSILELIPSTRTNTAKRFEPIIRGPLLYFFRDIISSVCAPRFTGLTVTKKGHPSLSRDLKNFSENNEFFGYSYRTALELVREAHGNRDSKLGAPISYAMTQERARVNGPRGPVADSFTETAFDYLSLCNGTRRTIFNRPLYRSLPTRKTGEPRGPVALLNFLAELDNEWDFWREWYQGFLDGKPLDWELQWRVALIEDAIWERGPEAVAAAIDGIKAEMLAGKLPMAETIEVNPATGKFRAVPIPVQNHPHMSALLNQVEDALEDCLGGHNGLRETAGDVRKLNRVLGKYREDPQNAELTLSTVAGSLRRQIHESRELPDNEDNLALLSTVEDAVRGIRAEHPEVEENRLKRASLTVQELPEADKALLQSALPVLEELSDEPLGEDFGEDFAEMLSPRLHNDAVGPVPDLPAGAKPLMGEYRAFSRISKMALLVEKGAKIFDSKEIKSARLAHLGYTVVQLLTQLVQIGWRLFEVLL